MEKVINSISVNENGLGEVTTAVEAWLEDENETSATLYIQASVYASTDASADEGEEGDSSKFGIAVQAGYSEAEQTEPTYLGDAYYGVIDYAEPAVDAEGTSYWTLNKTKEVQTIACYAKSYGYHPTGDSTEAYPTDNLVSCEIEIPAITSYTISFDTNGSSTTVEPLTKWHNENLVLPTLTENDAPVANAYNFKGWGVSADAQEVIGENYADNAEATLYAVWEPKTFTVTFDGNEGTISTPSKSVVYNSTYGTLPVPTRTGHTFAGWYTAASEGDNVTSDTIVSITSDQTLYAQWNINTYTVSYNANNGTNAPESQVKTYDVDLVLSDVVPERVGYTFEGWSTSVDGTAKYQAGDTFKTNVNTTLYAVWKIITFIVSYDSNTGTYAPESVIKEYGTDIVITSELPFKNGYKFLGWSDASDGIVKYIGGDSYSDNADIKLYALWEQIPIMRMLNKHEVYDEVAREHLTGFVTHGSGDAYTANVRGLHSLEVGAAFTMVPHVASTSTSPTLDVNGFGAKQICKRVLGSEYPAAGDFEGWLSEGKPVNVVYDGDCWIADVYGITSIESGGTGASNAVKALHNLGIHWGFDDAETYWSGIENGSELKKNTIYIQIN